MKAPAQRFSLTELCMALAIVFIWGLNFVAMKHGLRELTPLQLAAARFILASLPFIAFVKLPKMHWRFWVSYGLLQGVGQFGLLFVALHVGMTAALASVLMQTQVFFTAILAWWFLHETPSTSQRWALAVAALSVACFAISLIATNTLDTLDRASISLKNDDLRQIAAVTALGFALNLGAAAMWASSNVLVRRANAEHPGYNPVSLVVWSCLPAAPVLLGLSLLVDGTAAQANWLSAGWGAWGAAAYLAVLASIAAYAMWTTLLQRHAANRVAPFSLGVPVVGLAAGMLLLDEHISPWQWVGIAGVVAALLITLFGDRFLKKNKS
jgi:O-acetylserine/cysteine efflux transporter